jgi:hypothetical protein
MRFVRRIFPLLSSFVTFLKVFLSRYILFVKHNHISWLSAFWFSRLSYRLALRLWNNGIAHSLKRDQAILKDEGIYSISNACSRRVSGPLKKENIAGVDGFDSPLRLGERLEKIGKELAYRILATANTRRADKGGGVGVIDHNGIEIFGTQGLSMVSKDFFRSPFR